MTVMPVVAVLPAPSVPVTTKVFAHPAKVPVLLREVVPFAETPLTMTEAIPFVSLAVPASVMDDHVTCWLLVCEVMATVGAVLSIRVTVAVAVQALPTRS